MCISYGIFLRSSIAPHQQLINWIVIIANAQWLKSDNKNNQSFQQHIGDHTLCGSDCFIFTIFRWFSEIERYSFPEYCTICSVHSIENKSSHQKPRSDIVFNFPIKHLLLPCINSQRKFPLRPIFKRKQYHHWMDIIIHTALKFLRRWSSPSTITISFRAMNHHSSTQQRNIYSIQNLQQQQKKTWQFILMPNNNATSQNIVQKWHQIMKNAIRTKRNMQPHKAVRFFRYFRITEVFDFSVSLLSLACRSSFSGQ